MCRHLNKVVNDWVHDYQRALARGGVTAMADVLLPPEFSDLEPFAKAWCIASEPERYAKRLASTMDEMQAFYDACFPRAEEAIAYLDKFPRR